MKKEKLEAGALVVLLGLGLIYGYYTYLLSPEIETIKQKTGQLTERGAYYQRLQNYAGNEAGLDKEIQTLEQEVKGLAVMVPARLDKPQIMVDLYTLAKQKGVYPQTVVFAEPQVKSGYQELPLTFSCLGQPDNVLSMISALVASPDSKLALQAVNLTQQQGVLRAELKLTGYFSQDALPGEKPPFMNSSFGVDDAAQMFQP